MTGLRSVVDLLELYTLYYGALTPQVAAMAPIIKLHEHLARPAYSLH
jgi:hypothetical protein